MHIMVISGAALAGKTTHAKLIAQNFGGTYIKKPDEMIWKNSVMLESIFEAPKSLFVLDGFPANSSQQTMLDNLLAIKFPQILGLNIWLDIPFNIILGRAPSHAPPFLETEYSHFINKTLPIWNNLDRHRWFKVRLDLKQETPIPEIWDHVRRLTQSFVNNNYVISSRG